MAQEDLLRAKSSGSAHLVPAVGDGCRAGRLCASPAQLLQLSPTSSAPWLGPAQLDTSCGNPESDSSSQEGKVSQS